MLTCLQWHEKYQLHRSDDKNQQNRKDKKVLALGFQAKNSFSVLLGVKLSRVQQSRECWLTTKAEPMRSFYENDCSKKSEKL